jgi:hypothetical protein
LAASTHKYSTCSTRRCCADPLGRAREDAHMLAALGHGGDVLGFQVRAFGSPGGIDDATRRALVEHSRKQPSGIPGAVQVEAFMWQASTDTSFSVRGVDAIWNFVRAHPVYRSIPEPPAGWTPR